MLAKNYVIIPLFIIAIAIVTYDVFADETSAVPDGFGPRLLEAIRDADSTQAKLGQILGFTSGKISKATTGQQILLLHDVVLAGRTLGVQPWWLLTGEGLKKSSATSFSPPSFESLAEKNEFILKWRKEFGIHLRTELARSNINGKELAQALGYTGSGKLSKVITGQQELMPNAFIKTIRIIGVDPNLLLSASFENLDFYRTGNETMLHVKPIESVESNSTNCNELLRAFSTENLVSELTRRGWAVNLSKAK